MIIDKLAPKIFLEKFLSSDSTIEIKSAGISVFDNTWFIAERTVPDHLVSFIASGTIEITLNKHTFRLNEGNLIWVQPGVTQKIWISPHQAETKVLFVRFHVKAGQNYIGLDNKYLLMDDFFHLQNHFHDFLIKLGEPSLFKSLIQKASISLILCDILNEPQKKEAFNNGLKRFQILQLQNYIQKNISKRFTSKELSKDLKMNNDYFSRQFKKSFKQSPKEYINQERLRRAATLLMESNMNISEIAEFLGYQNIYQFSLQFKKLYGKSPNNYRKNN